MKILDPSHVIFQSDTKITYTLKLKSPLFKCSTYKVRVQNSLFSSGGRWFSADALSKSILYPLPNPSVHLNTDQLCSPTQFCSKRLQVRELNYQPIRYSYKYPTSKVKVFKSTIKTHFVNSFSSCLKHITQSPFYKVRCQLIRHSPCFHPLQKHSFTHKTN